MTKTLILVLLLFPLYLGANGQSYKMRHTSGAFAAEASFATTADGMAVNAGLVNFISDKHQQLLVLGGETGDVGTTDYQSVYVGYFQQYSLLDISREIYINVFCGPSVAYETIDNPLLKKKEEEFAPFVSAGTEIEAYVNNKIAVLAKAQQNYHFKLARGNWSYQLSVGLRYIF